MNRYPLDWPEIARKIKIAANWKCVRCGASDSRKGWRVLTVHHLDGDPANCRWWNLPALCQRCHLSVQARVVMEQPFVFEHSAWFRPYAAGFYAWKYLHQDLNREQVTERMEELLALERIV
jgi:5-methylcytosine-specific restriction endonuclease McrA